MLEQIRLLLVNFRPWDFFDIFIVSVVLYYFYMFLRGTRAATLAKGLLVLLAATFVSHKLELHVIYWLLQKSLTVLLVALPVVFQPELRRALEQLGRGHFFTKTAFDKESADKLLTAMSDALLTMARQRTGALLVLERNVGLSNYVETGVKIDAVFSAELLVNIFAPNTPLHDGAVIVRGNRIIAAAALLPLTEERGISPGLGTRHRAAIGLSEQSDALILVVSEESGIISLASGGYLRRNLSGEDIKKTLRPVLLDNSRDLASKKFLRYLRRSWRKSK